MDDRRGARPLGRWAAVLFLAAVLAGGGILALPADGQTLKPAAGGVSTALAGSGGLTGRDWATYLANNARTGDNSGDRVLNATNAALMVNLWHHRTNRSVAAPASIVGQRAYIGSWDGNFSAYDLKTGAVDWKTFLGVSVYCPSPRMIGVSSGATVLNHVVYVGGGNGTYWALNASTGKVLWMFRQGSPLNGYYSWSSPLVWNGNVYVGVASLCDQPLVPGGLEELSASNGTLERAFHTVVSPNLGGSIWASPALDVATNTIFVATGNPPNTTDGSNYTQAVIALNATTLTVKSYWDVPAAQSIFDGDFGATPTLFTDSIGRPLVGAINKNGWFYAFDRRNLSAGPVWERQVSHLGSVAPAAFAGGLLFVGTMGTKVHGVMANGSVEALLPGNGTTVWHDALPAPVYGAPTTANGLLFVPSGGQLSVLKAANGALLQSFACRAAFLSAPAISHGVVVEGCGDGQVRAYGVPNVSAAVLHSATAKPSVGPGPSPDWRTARAREARASSEPEVTPRRTRPARARQGTPRPSPGRSAPAILRPRR